ncbi:hypothetical protein ACQR3P_29330 [Rhodococcus sp. IEGM1300]
MNRIKIVEDLGYKLPIKHNPEEAAKEAKSQTEEEKVGATDE